MCQVRAFHALVVLILALCAAARPARASIDVAVLGIDGADVPSEAVQVLTDALRQHAQGLPGVRLLPGKDLVEVKLVFGCMDERPSCMAQAGKSLGAKRLIYGGLHRPQGGGPGYTVVLKQINVKTGRVEKFVSDTVPQRIFHARSTELDQQARKWLDMILIKGLFGTLKITSTPSGAQVALDGVSVGQTPLQIDQVVAGSHTVIITHEGHEEVIQSFEQPGGLIHEMSIALERKPGARVEPAGRKGAAVEGPVRKPEGPARSADVGRPLRILSYVLVGAAAIVGGISIYTWRTYVGEQAPARVALDGLESGLQGASPEVNDFFRSSERLSSCEPPVELTDRAREKQETVTAYNSYIDHCTRGRAYARATTGLLATMGSVALLGVLTYIIGDRLGRSGPKDDPGKDLKRKAFFYRPRLKLVSPVFTPSGGGLDLSFQF